MLVFEYSVLSSVEIEDDEDELEMDLCRDSVSLLFPTLFLSACSYRLGESAEFGN